MSGPRAVHILGASGHGRELAAIAALAWRAGNQPRPVVFLDDDPALAGSLVGDVPVIGPVSGCAADASCLLGVGYPEQKSRVLGKLTPGARSWPVLVHPGAWVGPRVSLAQGCVVQASCVLTCDIELAEHVSINLGATLSHDVRVGRLSSIAPGAHIGGNVQIGEGVLVGIGASVRQGVTIGAWSVVGAGAAVVSDVPPNTVVGGVPARVLQQRTQGWQHE